MKKTLTIVLMLAGIPLLQAQTTGKTFSDGTLPEALRQYDVNEDGILDAEERAAAKADREEKHKADRLSRWDLNGDGVIDDEERAAARAAMYERIIAHRTAMFEKLAGDDGLLSLEEFSTIPALKDRTEEQIAYLFDHLDKNDDDFVSLEEFLARLTRHNKTN